MKHTILFVDDDIPILDTLYNLLSDEYQVITADNGQKALDLLDKHKVHVLISDQNMPGMTGTEVLKAAKEKHPTVVRILVTGVTDLDEVIDTINTGDIFRFIHKPWKIFKLKETVELACKMHDELDSAAAMLEEKNHVRKILEARRHHVLFIDPNGNQLYQLQQYFATGYQVYLAETAEQAYEILKRNTIEVLVSEAKIGETDGVDFLSVIRDDYPDIMPILLTDHRDIEFASRMVNESRIFKYLIKPYRFEWLRKEIEEAVNKYIAYQTQTSLNPNRIELDLITERPLRQPETLAEALEMARERFIKRATY